MTYCLIFDWLIKWFCFLPIIIILFPSCHRFLPIILFPSHNCFFPTLYSSYHFLSFPSSSFFPLSVSFPSFHIPPPVPTPSHQSIISSHFCLPSCCFLSIILYSSYHSAFFPSFYFLHVILLPSIGVRSSKVLFPSHFSALFSRISVSLYITHHSVSPSFTFPSPRPIPSHQTILSEPILPLLHFDTNEGCFIQYAFYGDGWDLTVSFKAD